MGKYRNRLQIVADILSVVQGGVKKTQIMYQANLSFKLSNRYLTEILDAGLVDFDGVSLYVLTPKGEEFLRRYEQYSRRLKKLNKRLNDIDEQRIVLEKMCPTRARHQFRHETHGKRGEAKS